MYYDYFGLTEAPFDLSTDPRFLYMSTAHSRARAYLDYAVYKGDSLVVITGEIGVGKSTLLHEISMREHEHADVVIVRQPRCDTVGFLQALLLQWGLEASTDNKPELIAALQNEIVERFTWGKRTTLIIDEAQTLERVLLEELRMLADYQVGSSKPLAIVLVGQPCLRGRLAGDDMEQVRQRVRLSYHLSALDRTDTRRYIEKRLEVAGATAEPWPLFHEDTIGRLHRYTGGIPRLINVLADMAMTAACLDGVNSVTLKQIDSAIAELGWVPYTRRRRQAALAMPGTGRTAQFNARLGDGAERLVDMMQAGAAPTASSLQRLSAHASKVAGKVAGHIHSGSKVMRAGLLPASVNGADPDIAADKTGKTLAVVSGPSTRSVLIASVACGTAIYFIGVMTASVFFAPGVTDRDYAANQTSLAALAMPQSGSAHKSSEPAHSNTGSDSVKQDISTVNTDAAPLNRTAPTVMAIYAATAPAATVQTASVEIDQKSNSDRTAVTSKTSGTKRVSNVQIAVAKTKTVAPAARPTSQTVPPIVDTVSQSAALAPGVEGPAWLLAQAPDTYTIQLLAAKDPQVARRFVLNNARGLELASYRRIRDNEEWYVVVSGLYPNYPSAKKASATLPGAVRSTGPWVRPTATVQDDIRAAGSQLQARNLL